MAVQNFLTTNYALFYKQQNNRAMSTGTWLHIEKELVVDNKKMVDSNGYEAESFIPLNVDISIFLEEQK